MNGWPLSMTVATALALALTVPAPGEAATIYGTIRQGGKPVANADVELACARGRDSRRTDARGAYRFTINQAGRCVLRVLGASSPVILYEDPTRYDFDVRQEGGRSRLIRQ